MESSSIRNRNKAASAKSVPLAYQTSTEDNQSDNTSQSKLNYAIKSSYCIIFDNSNHQFIDHIHKTLIDAGFIINELVRNDKEILCTITCRRVLIESTASFLRFLKISIDSKYEPFNLSHATNFRNYNNDDFFSSNEELFLLYEALYRVEVTDEFHHIISLASSHNKESIYHHNDSIKNVIDESGSKAEHPQNIELTQNPSISTSTSHHHQLQLLLGEGRELISAGMHAKCILEIFPLHSTTTSQYNSHATSSSSSIASSNNSENLNSNDTSQYETLQLWKYCYSHGIFSVLHITALNEINDYFGTKVALYFAWMRHYTLFLLLPAVFGLIVHFSPWLQTTVFFFISSVKNIDSINTCIISDTSNCKSDVMNAHHTNMNSALSSSSLWTTETSLLAPFFSLFMILWGACFLQYWQRFCATVTTQWGVGGREDKHHIRSEFKGVWRISPITGRQERYYPRHYRLLSYVLSTVVTMSMLMIAFAVMIVSLNFQGYIDNTSIGSAYLHFPHIKQYSEPGCIFDQQGNGPYPLILPLIPCIIHTLVILFLNAIYRIIAEKLTEYENHATNQHHDDAIIIKRFLFEAFDCYIALFYLAFFEVDIVLLRNELMNLYMVSSIRRMFCESVGPVLLGIVMKYVQQNNNSNTNNNDDHSNSSNNENNNTDGNNINTSTTVTNMTQLQDKTQQSQQTQSLLLAQKKQKQQQQVLEQREMPVYDQFDDYMEMVIEVGYIVLFSTAFPLGSALTVITNIIEIWSDLFKLCFIHQRPISSRNKHIGIWLTLLQGIITLSILTNVLIFGFTTEQMAQFCPSFFTNLGSKKRHHSVAVGKGRWVVLWVFILEHGLFVLVCGIQWLIPPVSNKIQEEWKRRDYALIVAEEERIKYQLRSAGTATTTNSTVSK